VISMDKAARAGGLDSGRAEQRRSELAVLFLKSFPGSTRAARVVLMQAAAGELGEDESLRILTEVPRDSPVYETSRRQASRILYGKVRAARGGGSAAERDFAALRFIGISEELLAADRRAATDQASSERTAATERLVVRARQMLDALLGGSSPDAARAQGVLDVLNGVVAQNSVNLSEHRAELTFRQFQIALAREQEPEAIRLAGTLVGLGSTAETFAAAADRLIYKRIAARWKNSPQDDALSREVVRIGNRVIDRLGKGETVLADPAVAGLYATVAAAATAIAERQGTDDAGMMTLAIGLDKALLRAQPRLAEPLRRLAGNAEATKDGRTALECWRTMLGAAKQGSVEWFEARYHSLRLLAGIDAVKARELMREHQLLYPDFGPAPWNDRLRELDRQLAGSASSVPTRSAGGAP